MREIPQKGWYIVKDGNAPTVEGTKVYLDGKAVGGIRYLSLDIDAKENFPILKFEVVAFDGLVVDTVFGPLTVQPSSAGQDPLVFRSTASPEEILKTAAAKDADPNEIL